MDRVYDSFVNGPLIMYKPYSPEWHRHRYLKEAIDKYLDDYVDPGIILEDIRDILNSRSEAAYAEFTRINEIEKSLSDWQNALNPVSPQIRVYL